MEVAVEKMETQLKLSRLKIDHLAAKTQMAGVQARFDALMYVDELKALHAIAQAKLIEFKTAVVAAAAGDTKRTRLRAEMKEAWSELDAAFNSPRRSA